MSDIKNQIKDLPSAPGIYKFIDKNGEILYIGKAKNLKKRVSSYFTSKKSHTGRIRVMVSKINQVDFTLVESESEALLLENSLIKKHQPRYNVRLKDGKTYPLIAIKNEPFPRVFSTRTIIRDGSEYFGPFVSGTNKNYLLELLERVFKLRTCNYNLTKENIKAGKFKVCLNYHINLCKGPCEGLQTEEAYNQNIQKVRQVLKGKTATVIEFLKEEMKGASENLEFEKANELKQTYDALIHYESKSTVVNPKLEDMDVFSIYAKEQVAVVNYMRISNGAVIQTDTIEYRKQLEETDREILQYAITEIRERFRSASKEIILAVEPEYQLEGARYTIPKIGDKKKLLDLSRKNAFYYYKDLEKKRLAQKDRSQRQTELMLQMQKDLGLKSPPYHIECFDNSNIQGAFPVASMSVFKNGKPDNKSYRHFNIRTVEGPDDYASMEEVVLRRYRRVLDEGDKLPNLIVIDGGKGQLNAAYKSLVQLDIQDQVEIIGIAKKLEEIYKVGDKYPLAIDKRSQTNRIIQQARNEAHRFGISHHRKRRIKASVVTELQEIPGIGPLSAQKLLVHFKSVSKLKKSSLNEITKALGKAKARLVYDYFH